MRVRFFSENVVMACCRLVVEPEFYIFMVLFFVARVLVRGPVRRIRRGSNTTCGVFGLLGGR